MKKVFLAFSLALIMILSGCIPTGSSYTLLSGKDMAKSLAERMQRNADTHTLEGFTGESTFGEVVEKIGINKITNARLVYIVDFLGYPSVMFCDFHNNIKNELKLSKLEYYILGSGEQTDFESAAEDILTKLDAGLGAYKKSSDEDGSAEYIWRKNGLRIDLREGDSESNYFAYISIYAPLTIMDMLPKIPDVFTYQFGTDLSSIYRNETPDILPDGFSGSELIYRDAAGTISLIFKAESGELKLCGGAYNFYALNMGGMDKDEYFESIKESMEKILGSPEDSQYEETDLFMIWTDIDIDAYCDSGAGVYVDFSEEYFGGAENG